jgi:hypothetical protein
MIEAVHVAAVAAGAVRAGLLLGFGGFVVVAQKATAAQA